MAAPFSPGRLLVFQGTCIYALDTEYVSYLMVHYVLSVRGPKDFKFCFLAFLKVHNSLYYVPLPAMRSRSWHIYTFMLRLN